MSANPKVSALIVSYNVRQFLNESIRSLKLSKFEKELEIIVVDNNSFDGTVDELRSKHPDVKIIKNNENYGFGKAVNQAAEIAQGEFFLILNPDTIVEEQTVSTLISFMEDNPDTGLIGPKILNSDGSLQQACKRSFPTIGVALPKIFGLDKVFPRLKWAGRYNLTYLDPDKVHSVDAVSGSCMVISKRLFNEVEGFDPRFFMYGEDIDLCFKVHQKGLDVKYVPMTSILHFQGESVKSAPFDSISAFYEAMTLFSEKHYSKGQNWLTRNLIKTGIKFRYMLAFIGALKGGITSILLDSLLVFSAFMVSIPVTFKEYEPLTLSQGLWPGILVPIWIFIGFGLNLYSKFKLSYMRAALMGLLGALAAATFTYFFTNQFGFSRKVFLMATILIILLLPGWRILVRSLIARGYFTPVNDSHTFMFNRRAAIVGADADGINIMSRIHNRFDTGLDPIGFVDKSLKENSNDLPRPFLGSIKDIRTLVQKHHLRELVFASTAFSNEEIFQIMDDTKDLRLTYRLVSTGQDILLGKSMALDLGDIAFIDIEYNLYKRFNIITKRLFEWFLLIPIWIISLPIQLIFRLAGKFKKVEYWGEDGRLISGWNIDTKNGFFRSLPLLFPIIMGELHLVGPTLRLRSFPDPELIAKPGLMGLYQLRNLDSIRDSGKLIDRYYIQHQSFAFDIEILIKSFFA